MNRSNEDRALISWRNAIVMMVSVVGLGVMIVLTLAFIGGTCVSNYYNQMPMYPDAERISQASSPLIWLAIENPSDTFFTLDDPDTVQAWFDETVERTRQEARRARTANDPIPPIWRGDYQLVPINGGTEIRLSVQCI